MANEGDGAIDVAHMLREGVLSDGRVWTAAAAAAHRALVDGEAISDARARAVVVLGRDHVAGRFCAAPGEEHEEREQRPHPRFLRASRLHGPGPAAEM